MRRIWDKAPIWSAILAIALASGCVARVPAGTVSRPDAAPALHPAAVARDPGGVSVSIPFPAMRNRTAQYTYDSGFVYSVELHLYDSQGSYQNFLVVRNTDSAVGLAAGTASVTFSNVPAGLATLSVHTSQKQYYGSIGSGALITPSPTAGNNGFVVGVTTIRSLGSDLTSPFLIFRSNDISAPAAAGNPTSVLFAKDFFTARNGLGQEFLDTTAVVAGYGTGAATASIAAGQTTILNVNVSKPPTWPKAFFANPVLEVATFSAGATSSIAAPTDSVAGDAILIASGSLATANGDLIDLKDLPDAGTLAPVTGATVTLPATLGAGSYRLYAIRGSLISRIGELSGKLAPKLVVLPGAIATASFAAASATLAAGATSVITVTLKDAVGNPVTTLAGVAAGLNQGATVSAVVVPDVVATASTYMVRGSTYGSIPAFPSSGASGNYAATFTQGSVASDPSGTAGAATLTGTASIVTPGFSQFFLPASFNFNLNDVITVQASGVNGNNDFVIELRTPTNTRFASKGPGNFGGQHPYPIAVLAALNPAVQANTFATCSLATNGTQITNAENNATLQITNFGKRKAGDRDRVLITVVSSGSATIATQSIPITWQ